MGTQFLTFVSNHWTLWLAFFIVLALLLLNEYITQKRGPKQLSPGTAVQAMNQANTPMIDMRDTEAFRQNHIIHAKNIPQATLETLKSYQSKPFILVCARGLQSAPLAIKLQKAGFTEVMVLTGGIAAWKADNLPLVSGKKTTKTKPTKKTKK